MKHYDSHLIIQELGKSNLKKMSYQMDWKSIWALILITNYVLLVASNF